MNPYELNWGQRIMLAAAGAILLSATMGCAPVLNGNIIGYPGKSKIVSDFLSAGDASALICETCEIGIYRVAPIPMTESAITNSTTGTVTITSDSFLFPSEKYACTSGRDEGSLLCAMNGNRAAVGLPPLEQLPSFSR